MKYIVIYREHNVMNLETKHIGPFDTWEAAYETSCQIPALGQNPLDIGDDGYNAGCKYVEPVFESLEEAFHYENLTVAEHNDLVLNQNYLDTISKPVEL